MPSDGITPFLATPFTSGGAQALKGAQEYLRPDSSLDDKIGAATDMAEGAFTFLSPALIPTGLAQGAQAMGMRNLIPKALAGAGAGGAATWATREVLPELGVPQGTTKAISDVTGMLAGSAAFKRMPNLAAPRIADHPEGEIMKALPGLAKSANRDAPETIARGMDELRQVAPEIFSGRKFQQGWQGKKQGDFTQLLYDTAAKGREKVWSQWDRMATPFRETLRLNGDEMVAGVQSLTTPNVVRGERSPYAENLIAKFRGRLVPMKEAEGTLREINTYLHEMYKKSPEGVVHAAKQDIADKGALEALARNIRSQLYQGVDRLQGGKQAAELMRRYGALAELGEEFGNLLNPARMGAGLDDVARAKAAGVALAEHMAGLRGSAIHTLRNAVFHPKTVDQQLMEALGRYQGQPPQVPLQSAPQMRLLGPATQGPVSQGTQTHITPSPQPNPATLDPQALPMLGGRPQVSRYAPPTPPSRQLAAPMGPVGVSGTTVPQVGAIPQAVNREMAGPPLLAAPTPGIPPLNLTANRPGNLGWGSQHSQIQGGQFALPDRMAGPSARQPQWPAQFNADQVGQFALRNGITYVEALKRLQAGGGGR